MILTCRAMGIEGCCGSRRTSFNNDLRNDGVILEKILETVNMAFKSASVLPYWSVNTPRSCFMRSLLAMLEGVTEWVWDPEREVKDWELGGRPDLLLENEDDGQEIEPEAF